MFLRRIVSAPNLQLIRHYGKIIGKETNVIPKDKLKNAPIALQPKESESITQPVPIFTRNGDRGKTTTLAGLCLDKDNRIFSAIGATEELLTYIGLAREYALDSEHDYIHKLKRIQTVLIDINTAISRYGEKELRKIPPIHTQELEEWIEKYSNELPPPELYIIPGGGVASASLHVARSLCRRTERYVVPLVRDGGLDGEALVYLNRLSDFLFTLSRLAAKLDKRTESIYVPQDDEKLQAQ